MTIEWQRTLDALRHEVHRVAGLLRSVRAPEAAAVGQWSIAEVAVHLSQAWSIGVITRIWRIGKLLQDDRRRTMSRLGMDVATRDLLSTLRRAGAPYRLTPGEIARRTAVSAGAISQRLARAEQQGLVRRRKEGPDGRLVTVELTRTGHEQVEQTVADLLRHEEGLLAGLTGEQREQLADLEPRLAGEPATPGDGSILA